MEHVHLKFLTAEPKNVDMVVALCTGLDWVADNHKKPAVVTLSLEVPIGRWSRSLEDAVRSVINDHGLTVVVASGNGGVDSCSIAPANVPETITVAGSDLVKKFLSTSRGEKESIYNMSNTGRCVDIFAPGVDVYAACGGLGELENWIILICVDDNRDSRIDTINGL